MVLLISLEQEEYLVDVGNGRSCRQPLALRHPVTAVNESLSYRIGEYEAGQALYVQEDGADWLPHYAFSTEIRQLEQFADMCHFYQTSAESHFTHNRVVTIARPDGRISLNGVELHINEAGRTRKSLIQSDDEYRAVLKECFGIRLAAIPGGWLDLQPD